MIITALIQWWTRESKNVHEELELFCNMNPYFCQIYFPWAKRKGKTVPTEFWRTFVIDSDCLGKLLLTSDINFCKWKMVVKVKLVLCYWFRLFPCIQLLIGRNAGNPRVSQRELDQFFLLIAWGVRIIKPTTDLFTSVYAMFWFPWIQFFPFGKFKTKFYIHLTLAANCEK